MAPAPLERRFNARQITLSSPHDKGTGAKATGIGVFLAGVGAAAGTGAMYGAGFLGGAGTIAFFGLGTVGGLLAGAIIGGVVGAVVGVGAGVARYRAGEAEDRAGRHLDRATTALEDRLGGFTSAQKRKLESVSRAQWQRLLHVSLRDVSPKSSRQAIREAVVEELANNGLDAAKRLRAALIATYINPSQVPDRALCEKMQSTSMMVAMAQGTYAGKQFKNELLKVVMDPLRNLNAELDAVRQRYQSATHEDAPRRERTPSAVMPTAEPSPQRDERTDVEHLDWEASGRDIDAFDDGYDGMSDAETYVESDAELYADATNEDEFDDAVHPLADAYPNDEVPAYLCGIDPLQVKDADIARGMDVRREAHKLEHELGYKRVPTDSAGTLWQPNNDALQQEVNKLSETLLGMRSEEVATTIINGLYGGLKGSKKDYHVVMGYKQDANKNGQIVIGVLHPAFANLVMTVSEKGVVDVEVINLARESRGQGALNGLMAELATQPGVDKVRFDAGMQLGGYVWAKFGAVPTDLEATTPDSRSFAYNQMLRAGWLVVSRLSFGGDEAGRDALKKVLIEADAKLAQSGAASGGPDARDFWTLVDCDVKLPVSAVRDLQQAARLQQFGTNLDNVDGGVLDYSERKEGGYIKAGKLLSLAAPIYNAELQLKTTDQRPTMAGNRFYHYLTERAKTKNIVERNAILDRFKGLKT